MPSKATDTIEMFEAPEFSFPRLINIKLESFSLYSKEPNAQLEVSRGVLCLAGANGIGKSTYLAAVNFALTGAAPHPERNFQSTESYYQDALRFTPKFFDGRIQEQDRESASIDVSFFVGGMEFQIKRGIFDGQVLRELRIINAEGQLEYDGSDYDGISNETKYKSALIEEMGFNSFDQFVFLQHFVFTFDESRHLLFWDRKALEQALSLCFGEDPQGSLRLDKLRKEESRQDSNARNLIWDAKPIKDRIKLLKGLMDSIDLQSQEELEKAHAALEKEVDDATQNIDFIEVKQKNNFEKISAVSAEILTLKNEYSDHFSNIMKSSASIKAHPIVRETFDACKCSLCGNTQKAIIESIEKKLNDDVCPLCEENLAEGKVDTKQMVLLKIIDERLMRKNDDLETFYKAKDRLLNERIVALKELEQSRKTLKAFELENSIDFEEARQKKEALKDATDENLLELEKRRDKLIREAKLARAKRDECTREIKALTDNIAKKYGGAENYFVPKFRELAESFIGLGIDLSIERGARSAVTLQLKLENDTRSIDHQLSESQKFFLDIALRMALAIYISQNSRNGGSASLFVDTPEGSLDIAYESRAGEMFSSFAKSDHDILMTANINTSALLLNLAQCCGHSLMKLVLMTSWAELSAVQQKSEQLFDDAYEKIEEKLDAAEQA